MTQTRTPLVALALTLAGSWSYAASGGPDRFGYTWSDQDEPGVDSSVPTASGGPTAIALGADSVSAPVLLGFSFPFYGGSYDRFVLSSNGWLSFDTTLTDSAPTPAAALPTAGPPSSILAWFWRDLTAPDFANYYRAAGGGYLLIRSRIPATGDLVQMFIVLYESGSIKVVYSGVREATSTLIGIEDGTGTDGLSPWHLGVGEGGFILDPGAVVQYFPPAQLDCRTPVPALCGTTVAASSPLSLPLNITSYLCATGSYLGNETVLQFDNSALSDVTFELTSMPAGTDMDLIVLKADQCNEFQCLADPADLVSLSFLPAGRYFIVVDGRGAADNGPFTVRVSCTGKSAGLACGSLRVAGATTGSSVWDTYPCSNKTLDGPEFIYEIPFTAPGNLKVSLTPDPGVELDLLAFGPDVFDAPRGCIEYGDRGLTVFDPPSGSYFIMVDGRTEAGTVLGAGRFTLDVTCDVLLDCSAPLGDLECFTETAGTTVGATNRAEQYSCSPDLFTGPEVVYTFTNSAVRTVSFMYSGDPGLTLLLVSASCNEGACVEFGDGRMIARELPVGTYHLVVDGRAGAAGDFRVTPICDNAIDPAEGSWVLRVGDTVHETKLATVNADIDRGDVVFAMDTTGSMGGPIARLKRTSQDIITELSAVIEDVEFGLVSFEDYPRSYTSCGYSSGYGGGADLPYRRELSITNDQAALFAAIDGLAASGGGDGPESYVRAWAEMYLDAGAIGWRTGSRRIVVMFGDNEPHSCDTFPCGISRASTGIDPGRDNSTPSPDDLDLFAVMDRYRVDAITPIFLATGAGSVRVFELWSCWTSAGGGRAYEAPGGAAPAGLVEDLRILIEEKAKACEILEIRAEPGFEAWLTGITGPYTSVELPARVLFDFDLSPPPGTLPGIYTFTVDVICDGIVKAQQHVTIEVPGCEPAALIIADADACAGDERVLDGSGSTYGGCDTGVIEYQWRDGAGVILQPWDAAGAVLRASPTVASTYRLEVRCSDTAACSAIATTEVTVDVVPFPLPDLAPLSAICAGEPFTLDASSTDPASCPVPLEYEFRAGPAVLRPWDPSPTFGPLAPAATTTYTVAVRCTAAPGCERTADATVDVIASPLAALAPLLAICVGDPLTLDAAATDPNGCPVALEYEFREGASVLRSWGPSPTLGPLVPPASTSYTVVARCPAVSGCESSATQSVLVVPYPTAAAGADVRTCEGMSVRLDGAGSTDAGCPAGLEYEWREGAVVVRAWLPDPVYAPTTTPVGSRTYTLYTRCAGAPGCASAADAVTVDLRYCGFAVDYRWFAATWRSGVASREVEIVWETALEDGSAAFVVETSPAMDGAYREVGRLRALGSGHRYALVDVPAAGEAGETAGGSAARWYRIVEIDMSGRRGDSTPPFPALEAGAGGEGSQAESGRSRRRTSRVR